MDKLKQHRAVEDFQCKIHEMSRNKEWINIKRSFIRAPQIFKQRLKLGNQIQEDEEFDSLYDRFERINEEMLTFQLEITRYCDMVNGTVKHAVGLGEAFSMVFSNHDSEYENVARGYSDLGVQLKNKWERIGEKVNANSNLITHLVKDPLLKILDFGKSIKLSIKEREFTTLDMNKYSNNVSILTEKIQREGNLSLKQEQNLVKYGKNLELAKFKYDKLNDSLKEELPKFFHLISEIMRPIMVTTYLLQLTNHYHFLAMNEIPDPLFKLRTREIEQESKVFFGSVINRYHKNHKNTKEALNQLAIIKSREELSLLNLTHSSVDQSAGLEFEEPSSIEREYQFCTALYDFTAQEVGDLSFKKGDKIKILDSKASGEWWKGEINKRIGVFPRNYVNFQ